MPAQELAPVCSQEISPAASGLLGYLALLTPCGREKDQLQSWGQKMLSQAGQGNMSKSTDWFAESKSENKALCFLSPGPLWQNDGRQECPPVNSLHRPLNTGRPPVLMWELLIIFGQTSPHVFTFLWDSQIELAPWLAFMGSLWSHVLPWEFCRLIPEVVPLKCVLHTTLGMIGRAEPFSCSATRLTLRYFNHRAFQTSATIKPTSPTWFTFPYPP